MENMWDDRAEARAQVLALLPQSAVVKIADEEIEPVFGTTDPATAARELRAMGVGLAVVTLGERGCFYSGPVAGEGLVPAPAVQVVDTTGAGDGFVAGLLADLAPRFAAGVRPSELSAEAVRAACTMANRVASRVVTKMGATAALPRLADL